MHNFHGIVHRDLKPENIFISRGTDGIAHVKIGDFGLATGGQFVAENRASGPVDTGGMSNVGTALYAAPELERGNCQEDGPLKIDDSRKLDVRFYEPTIGIKLTLATRCTRSESFSSKCFTSPWVATSVLLS